MDEIVIEDSVAKGMVERLNPTLALVDKKIRRNAHVEIFFH